MLWVVEVFNGGEWHYSCAYITRKDARVYLRDVRRFYSSKYRIRKYVRVG